MASHSLLRALLVPLAATALGGCSVLDPKACTLIGCTDGLVVELDPSVGSVTRVEVTDESGTTRAIDCASQAMCLFARFDEFMPATATIRLFSPAGDLTRTVTPHYETRRPNGAGCQPVCRSATVRLTRG